MYSLHFSCLLLVLVGISALGCAKVAQGPEDSAELRIISLSPAISRTLVDLGLSDSIVGRTPYCDAVDQVVPVAGDLFDADFETLVRLRPTHVFVQPPRSGLNPELPAQAEKRGWTLGTWHLDDIDDIRTLLRALPLVLASPEVQPDNELIERARALEREIDHVLNRANGEPIYPGEVMLIVSLNPVTVFGAGTYLDDLLTSFGASNLIAERGYPMLSLEDVKRLNPPAILLVQPGADPDADLQRRLGPLGQMDLRAWNDGRVAVLHHADSLMPSSAIVGVAEQLHAILRKWEVVERRSDRATERRRDLGTEGREDEIRVTIDRRPWDLRPFIPPSLSPSQGALSP